MPFSGSQITRLGPSGIPRGLVGSFAGKEEALGSFFVNEYPGTQPLEANPDLNGIIRTARQAYIAIQNLSQGKTNNTGVVTLTPSAATTAVIDSRMTINSVLYFDPQTVNAAAELVAGTMYVLSTNRRNGTFTITHANNAQANRVFRYEIKG